MENKNLLYLLVGLLFSDACDFITIIIVVSQIKMNAISAAVGVVIINFESSYNNLILCITCFYELIKGFNLSASAFLIYLMITNIRKKSLAINIYLKLIVTLNLKM